jgi:hypothetical protein
VFVVPLADFSIEDPWAIPPACTREPLRRSTDGAEPRLATSVASYFDDEQLTIVFSAVDDDVIATYLEHDAPLYEEDVVEVFLAPERIARYFEIEVNPLGTTFDAIIDSPDGVRSTMRTDLAWTCDGLFAAIRRTHVDPSPPRTGEKVPKADEGDEGDEGDPSPGLRPPSPRSRGARGLQVVDTVIRIPFSSLGRSAPVHGETWRANFFRIDCSTSRDAEFSAWQPTLKQPADFHVPAAFGELRFQR